MKNHHFSVPWTDPAQAFASFADQPFALFFDQNDRNSPQSRYSIIVWDPIATFQDTSFESLRAALKNWAQTIEKPDTKIDLPFYGGLAGSFGYGLARQLEKLPHTTINDMGCPDMSIGLYDHALIFDHHAQSVTYTVIAENETDAADRHTILQTKLAHIFPLPVHQGFQPNWQFHKPRADFERDIAQVIKYIHAGDIFQANLSLRLSARMPTQYQPYAHYLNLRRMNAAPFSAYLNFGSFHILSSSPELFLSVKDNRMITRPIKGTLPDTKPATELQNSAKDRAENIMIVDLMRNDLSKVCQDDSIDVPELCIIETYRGLHHMVSTVTGTLLENINALDALKACFPGGSITGAPKIRAMEIIDELEESDRGPYCGAIGLIGYDNSMTTSIAIRTMIYKNDHIYLNAGSGIVADSDPSAEYDEMLLKARKLQDSFL